MHNNFFFLRQLSQALEQKIRGRSLVSCFTQNKDELVIEFNDNGNAFFLKASLESDFCCLSFPEKFSRARKNSMDLFPDLIFQKVTAVRQYQNERSFSLQFDSDLMLLFKMHGNRANVVLFENNKAKSIFRNHLKADFDMVTETLDREIDWSKAFFLTHQSELKSQYFTLGTEPWEYLSEKGFTDATPEVRWIMWQEMLALLDQPVYHIVRKKNKLVFSLLPSGAALQTLTEPLSAVTEFYSTYLRDRETTGASTVLATELEGYINSGRNFIQKNREKMESLKRDLKFQEWADLIMANLQHIRQGMEQVTVADFYHNDMPVTIPLRKELSPQANAESLYRKTKDRQIEMEKLLTSIASKEIEIGKWEAQLNNVNKEGGSETLQEVELEKKKRDQKRLLPYHEFEYKGFRIWVGKDAKHNDELTLKFSFKDDLWLHAKDVAGSHVLIKHQAGKSFPKDVIERAAELAAWHSKRKNDSLCPVTVTPKKFVRKRKGDPAGAVVVDREETVLVQPTLSE